AFAGDVLALEADRAGRREDAERARRLARSEQHPDLIVVEREGAAISADQADEIIRRASRSATEGNRKVLVLDEFHRINPNVAPKLLKTIEEPPAGTFFVVLADEVTRELTTIASRCIRVDFAALSAEAVRDQLHREGIDAQRAEQAAQVAGGDLDRARLLAADDQLAERLRAWQELPNRLNGTGHAASTVVTELRAAIDEAEAPLKARHEAEIAELEERIERYGQRGSGAAELDRRHKREARRLRTDELRLGLAALAGVYRDALGSGVDPTSALAGLDAVQEAAGRLMWNPNEELLLLSLVLNLPVPAG